MPNDKTYEAIPLFGEDGKIQYNGEVKPIFDQIGSQSPDNRMDNDEYLNLTKKHNGSIGITPSNYRNYVESRARNQSTWNRIGNSLVQTVGEIIGKGLSLIKRKVRGVFCKAESCEEANEKVTPGSILVVRKTDRGFIPSMERAAGVVSEEDGFSCHTAVASLDMGLPGIVGVSGIFDAVEDGMLITLDGIRGVVYLGRSQ